MRIKYLRKPIITQVKFKWLLPIVRCLMIHKMNFSIRTFITVDTYNWAFPTVSSLISYKMDFNACDILNNVCAILL